MFRPLFSFPCFTTKYYLHALKFFYLLFQGKTIAKTVHALQDTNVPMKMTVTMVVIVVKGLILINN